MNRDNEWVLAALARSSRPLSISKIVFRKITSGTHSRAAGLSAVQLFRLQINFQEFHLSARVYSTGDATEGRRFGRMSMQTFCNPPASGSAVPARTSGFG